jgi:tRNA (mo5U34)-methyltransferase
VNVEASEARSAISGLAWWHIMEVAPGVVTPGSWDLRPTAARLPWPSLDGARCLDIGTMDGFWAFEMERRGAGAVVAIDPVDPRRQDAPVTGRPRPPIPPEFFHGRTFRVAANLLGSRVEYRDLSVYDLRADDIGQFDVIVMGYVLQMVRDPLRALEAIRGVCRGCLIVLETISLPLELIPSPLARLDARHDGFEWFVFNRRGLRQALALAGFTVDAMTPILRDRYGPPPPDDPISVRARLMYALGTRGRSAAVRGRPLSETR